MRGSAAFRTSVTPGGALAGPWVRNPLWNAARSVPSLDLRFADNKSLVDATTGQNLVTFTRASSGTYVDSQGVIRTATTNLLLRSEEFGTTWTASNVSVSADAQAAPNGTLTADTITATADGVVGVTQTPTMSTVAHTFSVYARAGTATWMRLFGPATSNNAAWFDLSNGTVGTVQAGVSSATISPIGGGWYRCAITSISANGSCGIRLATGDSNTGGTNGTTLHVWGAQLEQSSTVGEYIPTTSTINSAPRFDHDPTTGESLGLLVEESRTNLLLQSNGFDTTWVNTNSSETAAAGTAPDGTNTAWELTDTSDGSAVVHALTQSSTIVSGTTYTYSVWMKAGTLAFGAIAFPSAGFTTNVLVNFNLNTGASSVNTGTATAAVFSAGNGWYRCSVTATATASVSTGLGFRTANSISAGTYQGDGTGTVLIWGAQLEAGSFPTSYIPTTTAAVTRSADVASISGSNFSSWYRQDEGTVFVEGSSPATGVSYLAFSDNSNNNRILYDTISTGASRRLIVTSGGAAQASINHSGGAGQMLKSSFVYKADDFIACTSGTLSSADTSGTVPTVDRMYVGSNALGALPTNGVLRRITYWPQRLPNSTLQQITQ